MYPLDQANETGSTARPGERIRVEEYCFAAENFLAAAYVPEQEASRIQFVSLVAVDVATGYILGFRLTLDPSAEDVSELIALVMRDKSNIARRFGYHFWKGWWRPKVIEARADGAFADVEIRDRLAGLGIVVVSPSSLDVPVSMRLASHACVSPAAVRKFRAADSSIRKS